MELSEYGTGGIGGGNIMCECVQSVADFQFLRRVNYALIRIKELEESK